MKKNDKMQFLTSRGLACTCGFIAILLQLTDRKSLVDKDGGCLECLKVYLTQDIPAFLMYCVYEVPGLSLLIESTDSMIAI